MKLQLDNENTLAIELDKNELARLRGAVKRDAVKAEVSLFKAIATKIGGEMVRPEDIGAMTDSLLIATGIVRGKDKSITRVKRVYKDNYYAIRNFAVEQVEWQTTPDTARQPVLDGYD